MSVSGLCGTDLFKLAHRTVAPGTVLGHEIVGTVLEAGSGAEGFSAGDRVVVPHHVACGRCALCRRGNETLCAVFRENLLEPGGFSELIRVGERAVSYAARKVPAGVADEQAVFLEPAACVLRGIARADLPSRQALEGRPAWVAVLGAGSMGLLHLLVLKAVRADLRVLVVDGMAERLDLADRHGADAVARPGDPGVPAILRSSSDGSDGLGAEAVFDTVGGAPVLDAALGLVREGGIVVLFGHAPDGERAGFDLNDLFKHERRVVGTYSGGLAEQDEVHALLVSGRLDPSPLVTHRLPLARFEEGVALARGRKALKVLYTP